MGSEQLQLIDLPPMPSEVRIRNLKKPNWTANKAKLIERYVSYFIQVTKHGTYLDGFAGPQAEEPSEMWSAKLVLELKPRWLRHLHFFEEKPSQARLLEQLLLAQSPRLPKEPKREVRVHQGDVNVELPKYLSSRPISEKEATFCLLDQRTFECHWKTVQAAAKYKRTGLKIEVFYFFPIGWLDRSLSALRNEAIALAWWGRDDWRSLRDLGTFARGEVVARRFRDELGYAYSFPWPIFERRGGGRIMYYMVHASDHEEAPKLMWRAYHKAVDPLDAPEQMTLA